ncbi:MAG: SH3 domain-containing protein [Epulopiscium sp.]|nr:SH3 domain-containing protein [Candidatus Epulonipiscium sp.]
MKKRFSKLIPLILSFILVLGIGSSTPVYGARSVFKWINISKIEITAYTLNVRTGPGTQFPVIGQVKRGQIIDVIGALDGWYVVHLPDNSVGVLSSTYTRAYRYHNPPKQETPAPTPTPTPTPTPPTEEKPPTDTSLGDLTADEREMFNLINQARKAQGLAPYTIDMDVVRVARIKAKDMVENKYFSHESPTYGSPFNMLKQFGISYRAAGENIAGNRSVQAAHDALMNSSGHRANILNSQYDRVGIGIVPDPRYGKVFVQMFIKK